MNIQDATSRRWDRSGVIVGVGRRQTYLIKLPSGRIRWRNRRFLRPRRPFLASSRPQSTSDGQSGEAASVTPTTAQPAAGSATGLLGDAPQAAAPTPTTALSAPTAAAPIRHSARQRRPPQRLVVCWDGQSY